MSGINLRTKDGVEDLKRILDDRPSDVLDMCGIAVPARRANRIDMDDPRGSGRKNFAIWFYADGLSWKCFTTGDAGKSLELIAYCNGWFHLERRGFKEAAAFAVDRLGLGRVSAEQLAADRAQSRARQEKQQAEADAAAERRAGRAFALFANAAPLAGTLAEKYLRLARGIDLSVAPFRGPRKGRRTPSALRYIAAHAYAIRDADNARCGESEHPAMIACCVDAAGKIRAVHQTWLNADGTDKATIARAHDGTPQPARKVFGASAGLVIPLWRGDGHLTTAEAEQQGLLQTLVICEGVEDGLSAVLAAPQHRVWAAISLSNIANVAARLPACCDSVIVHRQNDWQKPAAVAAFDAAIEALQRTGRAVSIVEAAIGKDLNDTLRGAA